MKTIITQIKAIRKLLHVILQNMARINVQTDSGVYNTTNAWHSMRMARGWLGKALGVLGTDNPYKRASKPEEIPPLADASDITLAVDDLDDIEKYIEALNNARDHIKMQISEVECLMEVYQAEPDSNIDGLTCLQCCWQHMHEASMNLGYQLQHIHEQYQPQPEE
jgi:hypothetical protein